jgi:predicted glycogen debranching enzyme
VKRRLMDLLVRRVDVARGSSALRDSEWLVTNGIGGYASGTVAGVVTRRYHGLLVAALPNPLGRTVMVNHLAERLVVDGEGCFLGGHEGIAGRADAEVAERLRDFRLEAGLPVWVYEWNGVLVEKRLFLPHGQNSVHVAYRSLEGPACTLELHPALHFRGYEDAVDDPAHAPATMVYAITAEPDGAFVVTAGDGLPPLRFRIAGGPVSLADAPRVTSQFLYPVEEARGYVFRGNLWTPGHWVVALPAGGAVTMMASVEDDAVASAVDTETLLRCELERRRRLVAVSGVEDEVDAELVLAADQFIITPRGRTRDAVCARAMGEEVRTVIAGYHWFTDWGRDTMIALEGLTLATGRTREAGFILRTFANYVRDGLIPNLFPDGRDEGLYHTADATLWFVHAVARYVEATDDRELLRQLLPVLQQVIDAHVAGTRFGIGVDGRDGLLRQGEAGYQLTWMDAKVDGWVVTPRRGKAVEINALWHNALCWVARWLEEVRGAAAARPYAELAARVRQSFNARFPMPGADQLYDVVDGEEGDSPLCRPNQLLAISLDHPVLEPRYWAGVLHTVEARLLTPVGLRSLAPGDAGYSVRYDGDLRTRDGAYHQGTVWGWLIGPFVDAWLRVHPDDPAGAARHLSGLVEHLGEFGVGSVAEIFDAEPPYTPRGCVAQAWSVAELLRCRLRVRAAG